MKNYLQILKDFEAIAGPIEPHAQVLKRYASKLQRWSSLFAKAFYDRLFSYEETARIFKEEERPERERSLKTWYERTVSGEYDDDFWKWQYYRVGIAHVARGIPNEFVVAAMSFVQRAFLEKVKEEFPPDEGARVYLAFKHVTDAIVALISAGYMNSYLSGISTSTGMSLQLIERHAVLIAKKEYERANQSD
ncbi:MAG: hypothetical protein GXO39_06995 [Thermotogae bacterium]|nr:hypothetical protein [Thermotogota bacterium]